MRGQLAPFIIVGLVIVVVTALALHLRSITEPRLPLEIQQSKPCEDGTPDLTCSSQQPFMCVRGKLVPSCSDCGCPTNLLCGVGGACDQRVDDQPTNFTIFILPIRYAPDDIGFLSRAEVIKSSFYSAYPFRDTNFFVVEETLEPGKEDCTTVTRLFHDHVQGWLQRRTGNGLPSTRFEGGVPITPYRIIGIDSQVQDTSKCGCGHTLSYSTNIWLGGAACGQAPHAILHEFGHTVGLCDVYDSCVYEETDEYLRNAFGHPCLNVRPNANNSDCGESCCGDGVACCKGTFADSRSDGFFSIMGSADIPPSRRLTTDSKAAFGNYLCEMLGVCG